jgi:hypothetical protein
MKKRIGIILISLLCFPQCFFAQSLQKERNPLWEWVIKPQFDNCGNFSGGIAPVQKDSTGKYGYIDRNGKYTIEPQFDAAFTFSEGLALVFINGEKRGFIDTVGNWVLVINDKRIESIGGYFRNGLVSASVITKRKKQDTEKFYEKEYGIKAPTKWELWGFIDKTGKWRIKPKFDDVMEFSEDKALVIGVIEHRLKRGGFAFYSYRNFFYNKKGDFVFGFRDDSREFNCSSFSNGLMFRKWYSNKNSEWQNGFFNSEGDLVKQVPTYFDEFGVISEDKLTVLQKQVYNQGDNVDYTFGVINTEGDFVIPLNYNLTISFSGFNENIVAVKLNKTGKWGFMNKKGQWEIEPQFDETFYFSEGICGVKVNGKWGYIQLKHK